jgi:hypothetical protein
MFKVSTVRLASITGSRLDLQVVSTPSYPLDSTRSRSTPESEISCTSFQRLNRNPHTCSVVKPYRLPSFRFSVIIKVDVIKLFLRCSNHCTDVACSYIKCHGQSVQQKSSETHEQNHLTVSVTYRHFLGNATHNYEEETEMDDSREFRREDERH